MSTLIEDVEAGFKYDCDISVGASKELYRRLYVLAGEVVRLSKLVKSDDQPIPDLVTSLQVEITNLKAQLAALSQMGDIVEQTRTALRQREEADEADKTAVRLPAYAAKLMAELDILRKG